VILTDSENARIYVFNPYKAVRTRCIDIRYKWIIEQARLNRVRPIYVSGDLMAADGLTKPLLREKHQIFIKLLGMALK